MLYDDFPVLLYPYGFSSVCDPWTCLGLAVLPPCDVQPVSDGGVGQEAQYMLLPNQLRARLLLDLLPLLRS